MGLLSFLGGGTKFADGISQAKSTPGAVIVDVRTPGEYNGGHVPGSINVPLDRIDKAKLDKKKPLFVYCLSGARSGQAVRYLSGKGYTVTNIGGIAGYKGPLE